MVKAAFLGRFQPFHLGHHKVIESYREEFEELVVVIGSSNESRTEKNPLTAEEREEIIRVCFPDIDIKYIEDEEKTEGGNKKWIEKLDQKLDADVLISQNELVQELAEKYTDLEVEKQELYDEGIYSGTEVRRRIKSGEEWRYLVPSCAKEKIAKFKEIIEKSGVQYEFEPGWKKENAYHGTAED